MRLVAAESGVPKGWNISGNFPKIPVIFQKSLSFSKIPGKVPKILVHFQKSRKVTQIPGKFPKFSPLYNTTIIDNTINTK